MIEIGIDIVFILFFAWLLMFLIKTYYDKKPIYWSALLAIVTIYLINFGMSFALTAILGEGLVFFRFILYVIAALSVGVFVFKHVILFSDGSSLSTGQALIMLIIYNVSHNIVVLGVFFVIRATQLVRS